MEGRDCPPESSRSLTSTEGKKKMGDGGEEGHRKLPPSMLLPRGEEKRFSIHPPTHPPI